MQKQLSSMADSLRSPHSRHSLACFVGLFQRDVFVPVQRLELSLQLLALLLSLHRSRHLALRPWQGPLL